MSSGNTSSFNLFRRQVGEPSLQQKLALGVKNVKSRLTGVI